MEDAEFRKSLIANELGHRFYLVIFFLVLGPVMFYCLFAFTPLNTYQLPVTSPGTLVTHRRTFDFWRNWLMWVYFLVFFSGPFMRLSRSRTGVNIHIGLLILLLAFCVFTIVFDIIDLVHANDGPNDDGFSPYNLARDRRWCCVYSGQPGTSQLCFINILTLGTCPPIDSNMLRVDPIYLLRFVFNILAGAFVLYDLTSTLFVYVPLLKEYLNVPKKR